jgi:regulator of protease activity HflC (stomatin/prohibitin superfamily)
MYIIEDGDKMVQLKYENEQPNYLKPGAYIALGIVVLWLFFQSFVIVPAGHRGVPLWLGQVEDRTFGEGFYFIVPLAEHVAIMEVRTLKYEADATSASKDLQDAMTKVALNYHIEISRVNEIYQTLGMGYADRYISPAIQETVKAATAQFTAEELITKRPLVKLAIENGLKTRLDQRGIMVETISLTDFKFSEMFSQAIEAKVSAEQDALKASNILERIKIEAQQKIAAAEGDAKAISTVEETLKYSPNYINWLKVTKWNGILPQVTSGIPFIEIPMNVG